MTEKTLYERLGGYDALAALTIPKAECDNGVAFLLSLKDEIIDA